MLWGLEFYDHVGKGSSTTVFGLVDAEVTAHLLHDDEEVKGGIEVPNAIRDTFSRTYFENIVSSTKECIVNCAKGMNDESEKIVIDLTCHSGLNIGKHMTANDIWVVVDKHGRDLHKE